MKTIKEQLEDIPGTYVFTKERSRVGLHLNLFCTSLLKAANREEFLKDEKAYLAKFPLTEEQRRAVLERDWIGMVRLGANIYHLSKLGGTDRKTFQYMAGAMTGMTQEDYRAMMLAGGRSIEGNRSKSDPSPQSNPGG